MADVAMHLTAQTAARFPAIANRKQNNCYSGLSKWSLATGNNGLQAKCMGKKEKKEKGPGKKASIAANDALTAEAKAPPPVTNPFANGEVVLHSLLLIDSYTRATGKKIFDDPVELVDASKALFEHPSVIMSHGTQEDPIYNYGNKKCLDLFGCDWSKFITLPSRVSVKETAVTNRQKILDAAKTVPVDLAGFSRQTLSGREYDVEEGTLWTITSLEGEVLGQAAIIKSVKFADEEEETEAESTDNGGMGPEASGAKDALNPVDDVEPKSSPAPNSQTE